MTDCLILNNLSSCEDSNEYYFDVLYRIGYGDSEDICPKLEITSIEIDVDRGITDFDEFGTLLSDIFPNLRKLKISQNYSCGENTETKHFLNFVQLLNLKEFILEDLQSEFLDKLNVEDLFAIMSDNSVYNITYGFEYDGKCDITTRFDIVCNKYLIFELNLN